MKIRKILALTLALLLTLSLFACAAKEKTLVIYTWADMFPEDVIADFEAATGYKVVLATFDTDEEMLEKLQQAKGKGYDLVIADDYILEPVIAEGLAQKLDRSKIANYGNINSDFQKQFYDPTDAYTIPYGCGVQTIVYNPETVTIPITGYADLWDPSLAGRVGIIGNFRVINGMALKVLGKSYNTENLDDIRAAGAKLIELAPNIALIEDVSLEESLLSGAVDVAVMYTGNVTLALQANPNLQFVYPSEGIGFGNMPAFIPSGAANADGAHEFLNFILDPERGAACFEWLGYYSTFAASDAYIDPAYKAFLTLPAEFNLDEVESIENISDEAVAVHNLVWSQFLEATGNA
ncbi:MAG: spermidine/putrescine ABC transporter substrate-binding protein [Oscillospiraceae bacterium]|jgi:spermidine/putrescine-binding protein|nr:spermidine/putrescine ABC transporter substrate-binding protein [Oscillospiraceae bacterium]